MFSTDDFANPEITQKLGVVIMTKIGKPPMTNFHKLLSKDKKYFNKTMNEYIKTFVDNKWNEQLTNEFNHICNDDIFTEEFNPQKYEPIHTNSDIQLVE